MLLVLLTGMLLVGVGEELVCRGYLLVGARSRFSELGAFLLTCALFGLMHGVNVVAGQTVGATAAQIVFAIAMGACFYLLRRLTGLLVIAMLAHGIVDVLNLVYAPPA